MGAPRRWRRPILSAGTVRLSKDKWGQWVIGKEFSAEVLAEAACKREDFTNAPGDTVHLLQGHSTGCDFFKLENLPKAPSPARRPDSAGQLERS